MTAHIPPALVKTLEEQISQHMHYSVRIRDVHSVMGGSIHHARRLETDAGRFFVKFNEVMSVDLFMCEALGLQAMADTETLPTAQFMSLGTASGTAYLLLRWIETGPRAYDYWEQLGEGLAAMHRYTGPQFGWDRKSYLGSVAQANPWVDTYAELLALRLRYLAQLLRRDGLWDLALDASLERFIDALPDRIPPEPASLVHGDLWSGNLMTNAAGEPVLIDPATHFGHRESDIAFTQLFGGYDARFYDSYQATWPMQPGWRERLRIYNLYPLMAHLHLFGRTYLPDIQETLQFFG